MQTDLKKIKKDKVKAKAALRLKKLKAGARLVLMKENGEKFIGNYIFSSELPLSDLHEVYNNHRRLKVFADKGRECVRCGLVGTRLIIGEDLYGGMHVDLYTDDLIMMTVDHIHPKSKGGSNDLSNLDPMCGPCNFAKGATVETQVLK